MVTLTIDTIIDGDTEKTLGSMANVWKALLEIDATLKHSNPLSIKKQTFHSCG